MSPLEDMAREWLMARPYRNASLDTGALAGLLARVQSEERGRAKRIVRAYVGTGEILRRLDEDK